MKYLIVTLFLSLILGCETNAPKTNEYFILEGEIGHRIDTVLTPYLQELKKLTDNTAGLAVAVTKGDEIVFARTFGNAQLDSGKKVDLNSGFHIASLSKPFSAIAVAKLIQENRLRLDDLIIDYIPEFEMLGKGHDHITIEHILTHTSGIPRNIAVDDWLNPSYGPLALEENLDIVKNHKLEFEPGTKFSYSNSAFDILGIVISRASGMQFHKYLETEILIPIGMNNTALQKPKGEIPPDWASAYSYGLTTEDWSPYPYNERLFPSSGVISSLLDMCKWGQFHLGKGRINDTQILDEKYFDLVVSPKYDTPWNGKIGLSWFLQSYLDRPIIMHTGFDTGFEAMMYIYPEENVSIVVLANRDFSRTGRIVNAASEIMFGQQPKDYEVSAKFKFAKAYSEGGIENAIEVWSGLQKDTLENYKVEDEDILTTGAILENSQRWKESKDILEYYLTLDDKSTYAWRLLGNANLNLGDTVTAVSCYRKTLEINPEYEKGLIALNKLKDD
jgi:CubicO group peptidase (beta-lactamase class C family)